jgi:hypothetical protein
VSKLGSLVSPAVACQPGCMTRGRYRQRKVAGSPDTEATRATPSTTSEHALDPTAHEMKSAPSPVGRMDGSSFRRPSEILPPRPAQRASATESRARKSQSSTPLERKKEQQTELSRLSEIAKSLVKLHREETALLRERDELIAQLRKQEVPWSTLAMRTGLSRQALSKRTS